MTALTILLSGALWLAAYSLFGPPLIVLLAASLSIVVLIGVYSDLRAYGHDRAVAYRRLGVRLRDSAGRSVKAPRWVR